MGPGTLVNPGGWLRGLFFPAAGDRLRSEEKRKADEVINQK
jgi:hypothetical protein